jgi:hypothetical protein
MITNTIYDPVDPRVSSMSDQVINALEEKDSGKHYRFQFVKYLSAEDIVKGRVIFKTDPMRICTIYEISDMGQQFIVKKGLRLGTSVKSRRQDIIDVRDCCTRMLEMLNEDEENLALEATFKNL